MFRQPISISRATFFVFLRVFFGVLKIAAGPKGSGGRQNQLTRAAGFEARLRGEAEQPGDACHPAGLRCTRGARAFDY